jgi:hypothetical protein
VRQYIYQPCIPTRGTKVPSGRDWLHEVKHDGFRLIVQRDGERVRLFTRNGHDWSDRYPWIVDAARRLRQKQFVIDGEAVILGVDGISDFAAAARMKRSSSTLSIFWPVTVTTCAGFRSRSTRLIWPDFWPAVPMASSSRRLKRARSVPIYSGPPVAWGWKAWCQSIGIGHTGQGVRHIG